MSIYGGQLASTDVGNGAVKKYDLSYEENFMLRIRKNTISVYDRILMDTIVNDRLLVILIDALQVLTCIS